MTITAGTTFLMGNNLAFTVAGTLLANGTASQPITYTSNAATPLTTDAKPLLTIDVWEHAYYIDYRNARPKYAEAFWNIANWEFAAKNFAA